MRKTFIDFRKSYRTLLKLTLSFVLAFSLSATSYGIEPKETETKKQDTAEWRIDPLKAPLSIEVKNVNFVEFFEILNSKIKVPLYLSYVVEDLKNLNSITLKSDDKNVEQLLASVLSRYNLSYSIQDNIVTLKRIQKQEETPKSVEVTGIVIEEENNEPIIGATIVIKGTHIGVTTDEYGKFKILVPFGESLVFSYLGKIKQELEIKSEKQIYTVRMKNDNNEMEEVVVTGYAAIDKNSFTGNAKTIKGEDLMKVSRTNVLKALQVFDPSFKIAENNIFGSDPNALPEVYIRGRSSLGTYELDKDMLSRSNLEKNPNTPTFVIDGFEVSIQKVYDLDPNRIESMTILKDAAATAMYGSRAANGVVVITTVPIKPGKIRINYNLTGTLEVPDLRDYNLMNGKEKLEAERLAGIFEEQENADLYYGDMMYWKKWNAIYVEGVETDWMSKPLRNAFQQRHSLLVESGMENIRYNFDLNYKSNDGVMKGSTRNTIGAGFNINITLGNIKISNALSYTQVNSKDSPYGSFSDYSHQLPYNRYEDSNGRLLEELESWSSGLKLANPLFEATLASKSENKQDEIWNNFQLRWNLTNSLFIQAQVGLTKSWIQNDRFVDPRSKYSSQELSTENLLSGDLYSTLGNKSSWNTKIMLSYNKGIGKNSVNLNINAEVDEDKDYSVDTHYRGFAVGELPDINKASEVFGKPKKKELTSRMARMNGILNYSYDNIYLVDLSMSYEGSSIFGENQQSKPYWAGGIGINIHNYRFFKESNLIDRLKLRGTYGSTGNDNFEPHMSHNYFQNLYDDWYITGYGTNLYYLGNPNLKSERTSTFDAGVEVGLWKERITMEFSLYNKHTRDMINDVTVPSSSGFKTYKDNIGEVSNKGFEVELFLNLFTNNNWNVGVWGNFARNKNELLKIAKSMKDYNNKVNDYYANHDISASDPKYSRIFTKYEEGSSLTALYGMQSLGIDPATGKEVFKDRKGNVTYVYEPSEQVMIGDSEAKGQGAFGFNLRYRNFTLSASFQYEFGGDRYNQTLVDYVENAKIDRENVDKRVLSERWQKPGDVTTLKDIKNSGTTTLPSSRFIQEYNLLSMNSLNLQYEFGSRITKALHIERLRLDANCGEIFRICSVKQERGLGYPFAHNFNFTLMVSF